MSVTLDLVSATVREDGYVLRLVFESAAVPPSATTPDWLAGAKAGATLSVSASGGAVTAPNDDNLGAYATAWDLPVYTYVEEVHTGTSPTWTAGADYYLAFALYDRVRAREFAWSVVSHFVPTSAGGSNVNVYDLQVPAGTGDAANASINVYLSAANGSPSQLSKVISDFQRSSPNTYIPLNTATPPSGTFANQWSPGSPFRWTCQYKLSRPIAVGETASVSGPAGLWQDSAGNATAAFAGVAAANKSLVDSAGFTAASLSPPDFLGGIGTLPQTRWYVSATHGSDSTGTGTASNPYASIEKAVNARNNSTLFSGGASAWSGIALLRGDVFAPNGATFGFATIKLTSPVVGHGISPTMGCVWESYWNPSYGADPGVRPEVRYDYFGQGPGFGQDNVLLRDIYWHNINLDGVEVSNLVGLGFTTVFPVKNLVISDCIFQGFDLTLDMESSSGFAYPVGQVLGGGIVSPGDGTYTGTPTVTIDAPTAPGGVQATATAVMGGPGNAYVVRLTITNAGSGYETIPAVALSGGGATRQATATLRVNVQCDPYGALLRNTVVHRTALLDSYDSAILSTVHDDLLISQCTFDGNGHQAKGDWTATTNVFQHDAYLQNSSRPATAFANLFRRGSGKGLMQRCGGAAAWNVFTACTTAATFNNVGGAWRRNVVEKPCDGVGLGPFSPIASGGTATFVNGSTAVVGVGTNFLTDLIAVGDFRNPGATYPAIRPHSWQEANCVASVGSSGVTLASNYGGPTIGPIPFCRSTQSSSAGDSGTFAPGSNVVAGTFTVANFAADGNHFVIPNDGLNIPYRITARTSTQLTLATNYAGGSPYTGTINFAALPTTPYFFGNTWNATFANGSTAVVGSTLISGQGLPGRWSAMAAGDVIRPLATTSPFRVASIVDATHLTLNVPYAGYSIANSPVDAATLTKGGAGSQQLGIGLQQDSTTGNGTYGNGVIYGVLMERNTLVNGSGSTPGAPYYPTGCVALSGAVNQGNFTAEIIERNNAVVGTWQAYQHNAATNAHAIETRLVGSNSIFATSPYTAPNSTVVQATSLLFPGNPGTPIPSYGWLATDNRDYAVTGQTISANGTTYSLSAWNALTGAEASTITTPPVWAATSSTTPPTSDLGSYLGSLSIGPASDDNFGVLQRTRPWRAWGAAYDMPSVVAYYEAQYAPTNLAALGIAPQNYYGATSYVVSAPAAPTARMPRWFPGLHHR